MEQLKKKKSESEECSALIFDPAYSTQILLEGCTHRNYSGCHSQLLLFTHDCAALDSSGNNFWVAIVIMTEVNKGNKLHTIDYHNDKVILKQ